MSWLVDQHAQAVHCELKLVAAKDGADWDSFISQGV